MKILNLYANIGGNRKLWGDEHEITAVEIDQKIASVYQKLWPKDNVVVDDAHSFLLEHYAEFDFIWSSPPCPTHSKMSKANLLSPYKDNTKQLANGGGIPPRYPDMKLYEEIIFLTHFYKGLWCVENVIGYYEPLIAPQVMGGHYLWTNFYLRPFEDGFRGVGGKNETLESLASKRGFDPMTLVGIDKRLALRDCTEPELGRHILECATNPIEIGFDFNYAKGSSNPS